MALHSQQLHATTPASSHEHATDLLVLVAAACSVGAAGIHFAVVPEHLAEYRPFGLFFVAIAVVQALWAILVVRYPLRPMLLVGAAANLATLALWAFTRSKGLPLGPEPWTPEQLGLLDGITAAFELGLVTAIALALRRVRLPRRQVQAVAGLAIALIAVLTSVALLGAGMPQ
jgi:MFS family permease